MAEVTPDIGRKITESSEYGEKQQEEVAVMRLLIGASSLQETLLAYILLGNIILPWC